MIKVSQDRQPGLGTSSIVGALTLTKTGTTARTATFPDAAIVVSGSAAALTSGRVPFVTTGGLLTDSADIARTAVGSGFYFRVAQEFADTSGSLQSSLVAASVNPATASTAQLAGLVISATSSSACAQNITGGTYAVAGLVGTAYHFGTGNANVLMGMFYLAGLRAGAGGLTTAYGINVGVQNLHTTTAITLGVGLNVITPANSGGNYVTYKGINIAASAAGTTNCIGLDIGAMTGTGAYAIRTSTGPVLFGDAVTVPNGTDAAPGIRLTSEASGLYRVSATSLGFAVAGTAAASLTSAGAFASSGLTINGQVLFQDTTARQYGAVTGLTQVSGSSAAASTLAIIRHASAGNAPRLQLGISRGAPGTPTAVQSGDVLYQMECIGADGATYATVGAVCQGIVDAAVSAGVVPSAWTWLTMNAAGVLAERMRISSAGVVSINSTTDATTTSDGSVRLSGGLSVADGKQIVTGGNLVMATPSAASTTAGTIQRETNQDKHYTYANGIGGWVDKCIFSQYATVTQSGVVTSQSLASATARGTRTLPANFFKVGKVIKFRLCGVYTTDVAAGNATVAITIGGTTIRTTGSFALDASITNGYWTLDGEFTCYSTGGSGTVSGQTVWMHRQAGVGGQPAHMQEMTTTGAVTLDTTASGAFDVVWTADDAGTAITCTCFRLWEVC